MGRRLLQLSSSCIFLIFVASAISYAQPTPQGITICDDPRQPHNAIWAHYCAGNPRTNYVDPRIAQARQLNELGRQAFKDEQYDRAADYFEQANTTYPDDIYRNNIKNARASALSELGLQALRNKQYDAAVDYFDRANAMDPSDAYRKNAKVARGNKLSDLGHQAMKDKQYDTAAAYFDQANAVDPFDAYRNNAKWARAEKLNSLGRESLTSKQFDKAADYFGQANTIDPSTVYSKNLNIAHEGEKANEMRHNRIIKSSEIAHAMETSAASSEANNWSSLKQAVLALTETPSGASNASRCPWDTACGDANTVIAPRKPHAIGFLRAEQETSEQTGLHKTIRESQDHIAAEARKLDSTSDTIERAQIKQNIIVTKSVLDTAKVKYDEITVSIQIKKRGRSPAASRSP